jgi:integrase/recombinase XerD
VVKKQKGRPRRGRSMGRYPFLTYSRKYLETVGSIYAEATVKELDRRLRRTARDLQSLKEKGLIDTTDPKKMGEKEVSAYMRLLRSRGLSENGQRHSITAMRAILLFCGNPIVDKMRMQYRQMFPKERSKRYPPLEKKDIDTIHEKAGLVSDWRDLEAFAVVLLALNTGLRNKELRLARVSDLDAVSWTIVVRHPKGEGRYGQQRTVPVLPSGRPFLKRYLAKRAEMVSRCAPMNEALFPALGDRRDGYFSENKLLSLKNVVEHNTGVKLDFRACRRTFGQTCLDMGTNVESVSLLLGHSSTRTTESHYCRRREDTAIKEVLELFDPEKSRIAEKPLIEREKYLSGYA